MTGLLEDFRFGLRALAKHRGFAAVAVLSLALGIGVNTTIFTFVNAIFLRPLPVQEPARLAGLFTLDSRIPGYLLCSYPNYRDYKDHNQAFSSLLIYSTVVGTLTGSGDPQPLLFQLVSANYFETLGVKPIVGRTFAAEEDKVPGGPAVAVISHALWTQKFGGDRQVTTRTVGVNGHEFQIIGVAPPGFQGLNQLNPAEVWVPMMMYPQVYPNPAWVNERRALVFSVAGRLRPDVSFERAEAEIQSRARQLELEYPRENEGRRVKLRPLAEAVINPGVRSVMTGSGAVLMVVAGLVLLIACGNVASLLLARATARNKEIAIRVALGASRWRVIRQLLAESTVLAIAGGTVGLLLASWGRNVLWALRPPQLSSAVFQIDLDGRVLFFTLALSIFTGFLFGLAPALRATRLDLARDLKERTGPASGSFSARNPRSLLVASEVALCVIALIGAGLFVRNLRAAEHIDPGFDAEHLGMVTFNVADRGYNEGRGRDFQRRVVEQAAGMRGVVAAALSRDTMFRVTAARTVVPEDDPQGSQGRVSLVSPVSPNYFRTTGIALVRGRDFSVLDTSNGPRVAIVNEAAAARYWPNQDPVGKRLRFFGENVPIEVIGVARNATYAALGEPPQALFYTSLLQDYAPNATLVVRTSGDPEASLAIVRRQIQALEPNLLFESRTVRSAILSSLWAARLSAGLLTVFGILALVLALIGIYGVISYSVNQRVREIGVRMALGATSGDVQTMILSEGLLLVAAGVLAGSILALAVSRGVASLLFVTSTHDTLTFFLVPCLLVLVGAAACWVPAHRATHVDPASALREE